MLADTLKSYGWITILVHWISAVLVISIFGIGFYMVDLSYYDDGYHELPKLHISLGLLLGFLMVLRVLWRIANRGKPKPLDSHTPLIRRLAASMKYALYLLIFTMIATGYLVTTAKGDPAKIFDLISIPATLELSSDWVDLLGEVHNIAGWLIMVLAAAHAGAALWHHFVIRDMTLKRMLKPQKSEQP